MACSAAHAQVLGGNVGGALNGTLGWRSARFERADARRCGRLVRRRARHGLDAPPDARRGRRRRLAVRATPARTSAIALSRPWPSARDKSANVASSTASKAHAAKDSTASQLERRELEPRQRYGRCERLRFGQRICLTQGRGRRRCGRRRQRREHRCAEGSSEGTRRPPRPRTRPRHQQAVETGEGGGARGHSSLYFPCCAPNVCAQ